VDLTNDDVADILALLDSLPYDSLDLRTDRFRLTLRRAPAGGWTEESEILAEPTTVAPAPPTSSSPVAPVSTPVSSSEADTGGDADGGDAHGGDAHGGDAHGGDAHGLVAVVAPLPGTFYRAPRPGAPPFVEVGDAVGADTVVAIIETMKLMNPVHAGASGRVARILLENGEFAPLGVTLLLIEPDAGAPIDPDARLPIDPDS
jgi:acetyl-CoA carboxylase biotin carboxyl carrier protein